MATLLPGQLYPESKDFLESQLKQAVPPTSVPETFEAAADLAGLDDSSSAVYNFVQSTLNEKEEKLPAKELNTLFQGANFYQSMGLKEAKRIYERQLEKQKLNELLQRSPNDFLNTAAKFAGSIAGGLSAVDIGVGLAVAPFVPAGLSSSMKFLTSNAIENVITEFPQGWNKRQDQEIYKAKDAAYNVVTNTAIQQGIFLGLKGLKAGLDYKLNKSKKVTEINKEAVAADQGKIADSLKIETKAPRTVDFTPVVRDAREDYVFTEVNPVKFADREFYKIPFIKDERGVEVYPDDLPLSGVLKNQTFILDNFKTAKALAKEVTGKDEFDISTMEFKPDSRYNLLDTDRPLEMYDLVNDPELIKAINRNFGYEEIRSADPKATLGDFLDDINTKYADQPEKLESFYSDLQEAGYEGIKLVLDTTDELGFKSNGVVLFDKDNLKLNTLISDRVAYGQKFYPAEMAKQAIEDFESYKSNYDYDPKADAEYEAAPQNIIEKTGSVAVQELNEDIIKAEELKATQRITETEFKEIQDNKLDLEEELTAAKMLARCAGFL